MFFVTVIVTVLVIVVVFFFFLSSLAFLPTRRTAAAEMACIDPFLIPEISLLTSSLVAGAAVVVAISVVLTCSKKKVGCERRGCGGHVG